MIVVDASALIAFLRKEAGHERVGREATGGVISSVNLAETYSRLFDLAERAPAEWQEAFAPLRLTIVSFDSAAAVSAAELRPVTRAFGLSLGDRACLALAIDRDLPVLTADRAWAALNLGVEIRLIR